MSNKPDVVKQNNLPTEPAVPDFKVSLRVRPRPSESWDGYSDTVASNGKIYSYLYTGGNEDAGNVEVMYDSNGPTSIIQVSISRQSEDSVRRYSIDRIEFAGEGMEQFTWDKAGNPHVAIIKNKNIAAAAVKYTTIVNDSIGECSFPCDPLIKNVPPVR